MARKFKPDVTVVLGDFADFYSVSSHSKNPLRAQRLSEELPEVLHSLDLLDTLGAKKQIYIEGNHEFRLQRFLESDSPALLGLPGTTVSSLLGLRERGWKFVPYKSHIRVGKLNITHDVGYSGKSAVFQTGAAFESNVVFGHTHRMNVNYFGNIRGETHVAATFGWLGSRKAAEYMHGAQIDRNWQLGFGVGYLEPNGTVHVQAVPIVGYKCVLNGVLYTG